MDAILTVNAGSSSLKLGLFNKNNRELLLRLDTSDIYGDARVKIKPGASYQGKIEKQKISLKTPKAEEASDEQSLAAHKYCLQFALDFLAQQASEINIAAIGHRVVHGGELFSAACIIDAQALNQLSDFIPLAPLHQPFNIKLIELCQNLCPGVKQAACFDTMFHVGQSELERSYAIPKQYREAGVQRYGFHGLSYQYIAEQLAEENLSANKTVVCHLGSGASMCAMQAGKSVASSMGFSALEGLVMGSRTGSIDPGVLLYLQREKSLSLNELEDLLYRQSGCLGVSGISSEMKVLLESDAEEAKLAVDIFCYRAALEIARLAGTLQGLDSLVFTGGIGENSAEIRQRIAERCSWLGLQLDEQRNAQGMARINKTGSAIQCLVIPTNEEKIIAQETAKLIA
ncbi:MAG: acetate/propionate family kinase [Cellvibrionaceae bacterium]|nr:acetate/propionate family kinase [Cellvibrionaceae bacterium]